MAHLINNKCYLVLDSCSYYLLHVCVGLRRTLLKIPQTVWRWKEEVIKTMRRWQKLSMSSYLQPPLSKRFTSPTHSHAKANHQDAYSSGKQCLYGWSLTPLESSNLERWDGRILIAVREKSRESIIAWSREEKSVLNTVGKKQCRFQTYNQPMQPLDTPVVVGTMIQRAPPFNGEPTDETKYENVWQNQRFRQPRCLI